VANVVAFGLFGMLVYPYVAHALIARSETVGLFLGTAIHDTSQVVGAALTYRQMYADDVVLRVATVTKLTRNLCLAAVIPALTWWHLRESRRRTAAHARVSWRTLVPAFVLGFIAMAVVRTIGDATLQATGLAFGLMPGSQWAAVTDRMGDFWASRIFLGTAMAAVGLNTSVSVFKGVGARPFLVGLSGALVVGAVGLGTALVFGRFVAL
jgi:uncharacterized membrane protein YadS